MAGFRPYRPVAFVVLGSAILPVMDFAFRARPGRLKLPAFMTGPPGSETARFVPARYAEDSQLPDQCDRGRPVAWIFCVRNRCLQIQRHIIGQFREGPQPLVIRNWRQGGICG